MEFVWPEINKAESSLNPKRSHPVRRINNHGIIMFMHFRDFFFCCDEVSFYFLFSKVIWALIVKNEKPLNVYIITNRTFQLYKVTALKMFNFKCCW